VNKETLEALKGSIEKWERIVYDGARDRGAANCPLCKLFSSWCDGCPVAEKTGLSSCEGTPYGAFVESTTDEESREAALDMLNFLKGLLP